MWAHGSSAALTPMGSDAQTPKSSFDEMRSHVVLGHGQPDGPPSMGGGPSDGGIWKSPPSGSDLHKGGQAPPPQHSQHGASGRASTERPGSDLHRTSGRASTERSDPHKAAAPPSASQGEQNQQQKQCGGQGQQPTAATPRHSSPPRHLMAGRSSTDAVFRRPPPGVSVSQSQLFAPGSALKPRVSGSGAWVEGGLLVAERHGCGLMCGCLGLGMRLHACAACGLFGLIHDVLGLLLRPSTCPYQHAHKPTAAAAAMLQALRPSCCASTAPPPATSPGRARAGVRAVDHGLSRPVTAAGRAWARVPRQRSLRPPSPPRLACTRTATAEGPAGRPGSSA